MQQFSPQTYRLTQAHHLGVPLAVYPASVGRSNLIYLLSGAGLRTLAALLIGVAWTLPLGVAIGLSPKWSRRLQPVVQVVASIPATALFPVLLLALVALPGLRIAQRGCGRACS
jgi:NitT/TauT family transport system permease protein